MPSPIRVGVNAEDGAATVILPAHQKGDLILIWAVRGASATAPSLPAGYNPILTKANSTVTAVSANLGYKVATSSQETSGTWTNATDICCHIYRPPPGYTLGIGASASSSSTTATITYPALALADSFSGNSLAAGFVGISNLTQTVPAPAGMTIFSQIVGASNQAAGYDTTVGISACLVQTVNSGATGNSVSATVEILLLPAGLDKNYANVYQHVGGGTNPNQNGGGQASSTSYKLPLPVKSGVGNLGVLWITVDNGTTPSVSDNINGSWGAAVMSATSTGNQDTFLFLFPNMAAGQVLITVSLVTATLSFQWTYTELYGMATASVTAGSHSSILAAGPALSAGLFTPTASNCVILTYCSKNVTLNGQATVPSRIVAGAHFTLLDACMAENAAAYSDTHASEIFVQGDAAPINPGFSVVGDTDAFNTLAIALKTSAGSGTPPPSGIQVVRQQNFTTQAFPTTGMWVTQCSFLGNCRVIACDDPALNALTVTDSEGNVWSPGTSGTGLWYLPNSTPNQNLMVYISGGGGDIKVSWRAFDVYGAATSPFNSGGSVASAQTVPSVTTFTMSTSPNPSSGPGLLIYNIGLGAGPGLAITAPAAGLWLMPFYTGENDFDFMGNADICALYQFAASGAITSTFTITSVAGNQTSGGTLALLAAASVPEPLPYTGWFGTRKKRHQEGGLVMGLNVKEWF